MNNDYLVLYNPRKSVIPDGWDFVRIGDHGKLVAGGTPSTRKYEYWENGDVPWMRSGDIHQKRITYVEGTITRKGLENSSATLLPGDSVLIALAGQGKTRGTVAINEISLSTNQSVAAIIPDTLIDFEFLYYVLDARYEILRKLSTGDGGRGGLNLSILRNIWLAIPPLPEQQKTAEILSTWGEAINKTEELIAALEQRKKGLMQRLLTGEVRFPGFEGKWEDGFLEDCCDILDSQRIPLNSTERKQRQGNVPYWGANGIIDHIDDFIFNEPLLIIAEDGGYFDEAQNRPICHLIDGKCWINNHAHVLRAKSNVLRDWVYYWYVHRNLVPYINSGTRTKLNQKDLRKLPIKIPSINEQKKITHTLSACDKEINIFSLINEKLINQKKGLMQRLLTGQVRVKVGE